MHAGLFFMLLLSSADVFLSLSGTLSKCQMVWIQIILSVLIWVKTVRKGYQQATRVTASKENQTVCILRVCLIHTKISYVIRTISQSSLYCLEAPYANFRDFFLHVNSSAGWSVPNFQDSRLSLQLLKQIGLVLYGVQTL